MSSKQEQASKEQKPVPRRSSGLKSSKIPITQPQTFSSRNREAQIKAESEEISSEAAGKMSASIKPDYFIAHNGLPNILSIRSRQLITKSEHNQQLVHPPAKVTRFGFLNQQAPVQLRESEKNAKNKAIRDSLRDSKAHKDLINAQIASGGTWKQPTHTLSGTNCVSTDNGDCKRLMRPSNPPSLRDNKFTHQRKYDNTIFRHDLPDRLVLPPLPI